MKKIMQLAGVEGKQVLFYFPDNHIVDERFLEDVNNVLNAGEVPNLFEVRVHACGQRWSEMRDGNQ